MIVRADCALQSLIGAEPRPVRVLLRTRRAAYLGPSDEDPWAVLVDDGGLLGPGAIALPAGLSWPDLLAAHLAAGAPVLLGAGQVRCGPRAVQVLPALNLHVPPLPTLPTLPTPPAPHPPAKPVERPETGTNFDRYRTDRPVSAGVRAGVRAGVAAGVAAGVGAAGRAAGVVGWPGAWHRWSSGRADPATLAADAPDLIGRGPGLTPSGDDVLAGAILTHTVLGTPGIGPAAARILAQATGRTTAASLLSLRGAARGSAVAPLRDLLTMVLHGAAPGTASRHAWSGRCPVRHITRQCRQGVENVLAIGHSSGADLLRGMHDVLAVTLPAAAAAIGAAAAAASGATPVRTRPAIDHPSASGAIPVRARPGTDHPSASGAIPVRPRPGTDHPSASGASPARTRPTTDHPSVPAEAAARNPS